MSSPLSKCLVCGFTADAIHFGAPTCRACAAFFRRKVVEGGKKEIGRRCCGDCSLDTVIKRRLCVSCRYEKCLRVGMKKSAVMSRFLKKVADNEPTTSKEESVLEQLEHAYDKLWKARKQKFGVKDDHIPKHADYTILNKILDTDIQLIFENFIPSFFKNQKLEDQQKNQLISQFLASYIIFEGAFISMNSKNKYLLVNGDYVDSSELEKVYSSPDEQNFEKAKSLSAFFEPYWKKNDQTLRQHIKYIELDQSEFLLLSALLLWDFGLETLSPDCRELCQKMRTRIFRELNEYEKKVKKYEDHCIRVGEIVIVLQAIQKVTEIFKDSRHMSILYNVQEVHRRFYETIHY